MTRAGMAWLIAEFRRLCGNAGTEVWTDQEVQDILDRHAVVHVHTPLLPLPEPEGGSTVWKAYSLPGRYWEGPESGTAEWRITDDRGQVLDPATYDVDPRHGVVVFSTDQAGSARYVTGRRYDLFGAAADGWLELAAAKADLYGFAAGGERFDRQQWFDHCVRMAAELRRLAEPQVVRLQRADILPDSPFADPW